MRITSLRRLAISLSSALLALLSGMQVTHPVLVQAQVEYLGLAQFPGNTRDRSGLTEQIEDGIPHNLLGGISAIEWIGENQYLLLSDKGPGKIRAPWACRFHLVEINPPADKSEPGSIRLIETRLFRDEQDRQLVGSPNLREMQKLGFRLVFDPEGFRRSRDGRLFVADEARPAVFEFDDTGRRVRELPLPGRFGVRIRSLSSKTENAQNHSGRQANGGPEGLAITPDGSRLIAAMQRPLLQDSRESGDARVGLNVRLIEISLTDGRYRELLYHLDHSDNGICEILAVGPETFLVLERDGREGKGARCRKIFRISTRGASDISQRDALPPEDVPAGIVPVAKSLFLDLQEVALGAQGRGMSSKAEGITFGPDLPDGRRLLIVSSDNDFDPTQPILFHLFALPRDQLPEFAW